MIPPPLTTPAPCATANNSTLHACKITWLPTCQKSPGATRRRAVPPRAFQPDVPDPHGRARMGPASPPFGNRVKTAHDMGREYRILRELCHVYPPCAGTRALLRRREHSRSPVLPDGAAQGGHPPRQPTARPADPARSGAAAMRDAGRQHGALALAGLPCRRARRSRQAPGLRRTPGGRLDQALSGRPNRRRPRPRANDGLAGGKSAAGIRHARP